MRFGDPGATFEAHEEDMVPISRRDLQEQENGNEETDILMQEHDGRAEHDPDRDSQDSEDGSEQLEHPVVGKGFWRSGGDSEDAEGEEEDEGCAH